MLTYTTVVISGGGYIYVNIKYIFCNKHFKAFLESQMSKDKPTPLVPKKHVQFLYYFHVTTSHCF